MGEALQDESEGTPVCPWPVPSVLENLEKFIFKTSQTRKFPLGVRSDLRI
jgi:hypothetical protein